MGDRCLFSSSTIPLRGRSPRIVNVMTAIGAWYIVASREKKAPERIYVQQGSAFADIRGRRGAEARFRMSRRISGLNEIRDSALLGRKTNYGKVINL